MNNKRSMSDFKIKKSTAARGVSIEGFANKAVKDRIGDLIPGKAWELENFKKNPIIFFNHDRNIPIGKATKVEAGEDGLKIKVKISKSNEAPIPFVRDMIKEGIIKTFSVGFDDHETFQKNEDGVNVPERAELLETSVVTLPMNQESDFDISKALTKALPTWKTKSYHQAKVEVLKLKGAWVSLLIQDAIQELMKNVDFDKDQALQEIALNTHLTYEQLMDVVTGNAKDISEDILEVLAESFHLDLDKLKEQNERQDDEEEEEEEEEEEKENDEPEVKEGDEEEEEEEEEDKGQDAQFEKDSFQDCVAKKIPVFIDEGMGQEQAIAAAISHCQEKRGNTELSSKDYAGLFSVADRHKLKEDASDVIGLDSSKESDVNFPNPVIDLQKAQLSMMGSQVNLLREIKAELQLLNTKADGESESLEEPQAETSETPDGEETEESKALDRRRKILDAFGKRLDKLAK
jgi:HK97 family phage prohead protease